MSNNDVDNPFSKKPEDSDFQQQRLRAWQPLLTPSWVVTIFLLVGVVFIPIGVAIFLASHKVVDVTQRYDDYGPFNGYDVSNGCSEGRSCELTFNVTIDKDMDPPVFFYYKLTNFYQNHRRYVSSRSDAQLRGDSSPDVSACTPLKDDGKLTYYPCGLIAYSMFTDTFGATVFPADTASAPEFLGNKNTSDTDPSRSTWRKTGIAWSADRNDKFKAPSGYFDPSSMRREDVNGRPLPNVTDEDFMVWMRTAGLPTFRKLYRIIDRPFKAGDKIQVSVNNVYPVAAFSGEKAIVISTASWMGGKNDFLGYAYMIVGALCVFLAIAFLVKDKIKPRRLGEMP